MAFLNNSAIGFGVHLAGQHALDQPRYTVADVGGNRFQRRARHAQFGHHQFGRMRQVRRGIQQRAVEIDDDGFYVKGEG
jgi:hypothetical protein